MNKHFVLKSSKKDINIVPKSNDFTLIMNEFTEFYKINKNLFNGINKFSFYWNDDVDYKILCDMQNQGIIIDIFKVSDEQFNKMIKETPLLIKRVVRGGEKIKYNGDIIIEGNVNPDAYIISTGDIYIMGVLKGVAQAGYNNDLTKKIIVFDYEQAQVKIGNKTRFFSKKLDTISTPKIIYYKDDNILINNYL